MRVTLALLIFGLTACSGDKDTDTDTDTASDTDTDVDTDTDTDTDSTGDTGPTMSPLVTWTNDMEPLFSVACAGCHWGQTMGSGGLAFNDPTDLVNVASFDVPTMRFVAPGLPDDSYLLRKLEGTHLAAGGAGSQMPLTGALGAADQMLVRQWIADGAL